MSALAEAVDLGQDRAAVLRRLDLLQTESRSVTPVAPLGGCSRRVLRHGFGPEVFEVDQEELGFASREKFQAGAKDLVVCNAALTGQ